MCRLRRDYMFGIDNSTLKMIELIAVLVCAGIQLWEIIKDK